jgi:hypothetical protein
MTNRDLPFSERQELESLYLPFIVDLLYSRSDTTSVENATPQEQLQKDIDLQWSRIVKGREITSSIEVKIDAQGHKTRNFAFETVSNEITATRGCFMRTESEYLFYLFAGSGELWRMPTEIVRGWFVKELSKRPKRFPRVTPFTPASNGRTGYPSICALVSVTELKNGLGENLRMVHIPVPPLPDKFQ